jgi:hypothetical protein
MTAPSTFFLDAFLWDIPVKLYTTAEVLTQTLDMQAKMKTYLEPHFFTM